MLVTLFDDFSPRRVTNRLIMALDGGNQYEQVVEAEFRSLV